MSGLKFDENGKVVVPEFVSSEDEGKDKSGIISASLVELNSLGLKLSEKIQQIAEFAIEDKKTMRCFYSKVKFKAKLFGLCWLEPIKDGGLSVHLRKKDYLSVDPKKMVKYSAPEAKTFGGYPIVKIDNFSEIDYVVGLIKWAYVQDRPNSNGNE